MVITPGDQYRPKGKGVGGREREGEREGEIRGFLFGLDEGAFMFLLKKSKIIVFLFKKTTNLSLY